MYPPSITVATSVSVHLSSLWLSFPFLCKPVGHGVGTWDDPSEQPCDGKAEFPADEECRDNAGVTRYWGLANDTTAALATFALLWGYLVVGQFFPLFFPPCFNIAFRVTRCWWVLERAQRFHFSSPRFLKSTSLFK